MHKVELYLLGKKYADYYQGRYSNAIIIRRSVYWLDTNFGSKEFHKELLRYILNEGQEDFKKGIMEAIDKRRMKIALRSNRLRVETRSITPTL